MKIDLIQVKNKFVYVTMVLFDIPWRNLNDFCNSRRNSARRLQNKIARAARLSRLPLSQMMKRACALLPKKLREMQMQSKGSYFHK